MWRSDPSGACDYLNQAWLDYTGRALENQSGNGWSDPLVIKGTPPVSDMDAVRLADARQVRAAEAALAERFPDRLSEVIVS